MVGFKSADRRTRWQKLALAPALVATTLLFGSPATALDQAEFDAASPAIVQQEPASEAATDQLENANLPRDVEPGYLDSSTPAEPTEVPQPVEAQPSAKPDPDSSGSEETEQPSSNDVTDDATSSVASASDATVDSGEDMVASEISSHSDITAFANGGTVEKRFSTNTANPGDTVTLYISVHGPTGLFSLTDELQGMTPVPYTDQLSCGDVYSTPNWDVTGTLISISGEIPNDSGFCTLSVQVTVHSDATLPIQNCVAVQGDLELINGGCATLYPPGYFWADLWTTKTPSVTTARPGDPITWNISAGNSTASTRATLARISDTLPANVTPESLPGWCDFDASTRELSCLLYLNPGDSSGFVISAVIDPGFTGNLENTASIESYYGDPDPDLTNNSSTARTVVADAPPGELALHKTSSAAEVVAGESIAWQVTVINEGPTTVTDAVVTDHLPAGITNWSAPGCTPATGVGPQDITCVVDNLPLGGTHTFDITATVAGDVTDPITNQAVMRAPSVAGDNEVHWSAESSVQVIPPSPPLPGNLAVNKSGPETATAGDTITWTITATNPSSVPVAGVVLDDHLPNGVTFVSATAPEGSTCEFGEVNEVSCDVGTLAPGETREFTITATINPGVDETRLRNWVSINAPGVDYSYDEWFTAVGVPPTGNLDLGKTGPESAIAGQPITWTITASNPSSVTVPDAVVTDYLPEGVTFESASPGCELVDANEVQCAVGNLPGGASRVFAITAVIDSDFADDLLENVAVITARSISVGVIDAASWESAVRPAPPAPLGAATLDKTGPETATAGESITWTITAENVGTIPVPDAVVTDHLPSGVTLTSAPGCTPESGAVGPVDVTCVVGELGVGANRVFTITATIDPGFTGRLANSASLTAPSIADGVITMESWFTEVTGTEPEPTPPGPGPRPPHHRPPWNKPRPPWQRPDLVNKPGLVAKPGVTTAHHPVTGPWLGYLPIAVAVVAAGAVAKTRSKRGF